MRVWCLGGSLCTWTFQRAVLCEVNNVLNTLPLFLLSPLILSFLLLSPPSLFLLLLPLPPSSPALSLQVCDTYPAELFVPRSATPSVIVGSSKFRSRGRSPALTYFHQDTLVRSDTASPTAPYVCTASPTAPYVSYS